MFSLKNCLLKSIVYFELVCLLPFRCKSSLFWNQAPYIYDWEIFSLNFWGVFLLYCVHRLFKFEEVQFISFLSFSLLVIFGFLCTKPLFNLSLRLTFFLRVLQFISQIQIYDLYSVNFVSDVEYKIQSILHVIIVLFEHYLLKSLFPPIKLLWQLCQKLINYEYKGFFLDFQIFSLIYMSVFVPTPHSLNTVLW